MNDQKTNRLASVICKDCPPDMPGLSAQGTECESCWGSGRLVSTRALAERNDVIDECAESIRSLPESDSGWNPHDEQFDDGVKSGRDDAINTISALKTDPAASS